MSPIELNLGTQIILFIAFIGTLLNFVGLYLLYLYVRANQRRFDFVGERFQMYDGFFKLFGQEIRQRAERLEKRVARLEQNAERSRRLQAMED